MLRRSRHAARSQGGDRATGRGHDMAVRSPAEDAWSAPEVADRAGTPAFGPAAAGDAEAGGTLDLTLMRAAIQDGVLMVFGPDGDPVPPQAFAAAAAARPRALVAWADGPPLEAERIASGLEAQRGGRLGSGEGGDDAWIKTMLGSGPRPEMADADDLMAEGHDIEVVAFGKEMMITSPAGGTFLIAEARSASPAGAELRGPDGEPVSLGAMVTRLLDRGDRPGGSPARARTNEVTLADCRTWIEDDALIIDLPEVGALYLVRSDPAEPGARVSMFKPDGETATIDELLEALSRPLVLPEVEASRHEDAAPTTANLSSAGDPDLAPPQADRTQAPPRRVPVSVGLPEAFAANPDDVALVVVRGLPHGASLSAGAAGGDGSWLLSPGDLAGLSLAPPPGWTPNLVLEIAAIAVRDRDGELLSASKTVQVALQAGAAGRPVPVAIDPGLLSGHHGRLDAIVVRDLPAEATLSAGAYDPAIDGWVLLPRQLNQLTVTPGPGQAEGFMITILGISLSDGPARSHLLAQIPITLG
jgi:hypothetical protein